MMKERIKAFKNLCIIGFITGRRDFPKAWKRYWCILIFGKAGKHE